MDTLGFTLWLTGLPSAGKSTLARMICSDFRRHTQRVELLDGDEIRTILSPELGFTRHDREINMSRIGYIANLLSRNGVVVVVAAVSPYRDARNKIREAHDSPYIEVFVDCALDELFERDAKGLYRSALRGDINDFTGVSAPYEAPISPEIHVKTDKTSACECAAVILSALTQLGLRPTAAKPRVLR